MGNERHVNFQWVSDGIFEMCERYTEQALRLVQDAESDLNEEIYQLVINQIRLDINRLDELFSESVTKEVNKALNFSKPDRAKIAPEKLQSVMELIDEFKGEVLGVARAYDVEKRMNESIFLIGAVMRCIVDLRKRVQDIRTE